MTPAQRIAVAGATGRLGSHLVDVLTEAGHDVVPISRSHGVDVITGAGLAAALADVDTLIDAATGPSPDEREATEFFEASARNLQQGAERARVERILAVSIIGCDRYPSGYNAAKAAHERALAAGPVAVGIVRASQFHELVEQMVEWGRDGNVSYVPRMRTQLVAARAVAEAMAEHVAAPFARRPTPPSEVSGPREESLPEAAARLSRQRGLGVDVQAVSDPSESEAKLNEGGALLPGPDARLVGPTFEEWLARG